MILFVRVTTLNHHPPATADRTVGDQWNAEIRAALVEANRVYNPHGIFVRESERVNLNVDASRTLLTADARQYADGDPGEYRRHLRREHGYGVRTFETMQAEGVDASRYLSQEFFVTVGDPPATRSQPVGRASAEVLDILAFNRGRGEVATYWVPGITSPGAAGHTLCRPFYSNVTEDREGIIIAQDARNDTLAHEIGHLLMRCGHCADPESHPVACECATADNLMHPDGDARHGSELTPSQLQRLTATGSRYLQRS